MTCQGDECTCESGTYIQGVYPDSGRCWCGEYHTAVEHDTHSTVKHEIKQNDLLLRTPQDMTMISQREIDRLKDIEQKFLALKRKVYQLYNEVSKASLVMEGILDEEDFS